MKKLFTMLITMMTIMGAALLISPPAHARDLSLSHSLSVTERSIFNSGDYYWNDQVTDSDHIHIEVNLTTQMAYVWSGDILIGATNVSSGRSGFDTPHGTFTVLGKEDNHFSTKYKANMPWTMWLTNDGVALHSGGTPGRPSSHGCVHLPPVFAAALYRVVQKGAVVSIIDRQPLIGFTLD